MLQIPVQHIERDCRTGMSQMRIAVHGRPADVHAYMTLMQRFESLLETS